MTETDKQLLKEFQVSWAQHKYWMMSHSQQVYNQIRELAKGNKWNQEKNETYKTLLKDLETTEPTEKTLRNAYQHIWGYFKKEATSKEIYTYTELIKKSPLERNELEVFLKELAKKYEKEYLLNMRWPLS
ncbi:YbgA family protein [Vagococcus fluvialis]|uniref:YbgA family protein n=1 Tax=Vagococcus fluvialis TaxID=2738 RepID=UPI001A8E8000|nr:YbgA family protein [Vagococcus fluvialis]MBO0436314.1 YbgA family protein [Vagococcus fluvialis]